MTSLSFPPIFERVKTALSSTEVYLVGGAVRDAFLDVKTRDLDFSMPSGSITTARKVADRLQGAFFILDEERKVARVILTDDDDQRYILDFTAFQGQKIEDDLRSRDFTLTAMAVPMSDPQQLIDPLGGLPDLQQGVLRACTSHAMGDDPLRILRAVRLAVQYDFRISEDTRTQMRVEKGGLREVSPERLRDEFFRMLEGPHQAAAMRVLSHMDLFPYLLPGYTPFSPYHQRCLRFLERLWDLLGKDHDPEAAASWAMGLSVLRLGRFRDRIRAYKRSTLVPGRLIPSLVMFAALYLPEQKERDSLRNAHVDAVEQARSLRLGNDECSRLRDMLHAFQWVDEFAASPDLPTNREIYRYFQGYGWAGVDALFLGMADILSRRGEADAFEEWPQMLDLARLCLQAWWEKRGEIISPPPLLDGHDLIETFGLSPGPEIGEILRKLKEEQAAGEISSRKEAFSFARSILDVG